jgi:iron complex transport system ATP-binding protein
MTEAGEALVLREAEVRIGGTRVLGPIDLSIRRGERWVLLGPNGSGKTTLLGLAGARRQPSSGRVTVLGTVLGEGDIRALHGRISHSSHVLTEMMPEHLTAEQVVLTGKRETLSLWFQALSDDDRRRATELLERFGCRHLVGRRIATGSQGERQRVLLARAMFAAPELTILDEPASGLDMPARESLLGALEAIAAMPDPPTTIVATHHLEEIAPSTTHAALLRTGSLVAAGPIEDVLTAERLGACIGLDVEVGRNRGRWWAVASGASARTRGGRT